jgi:hypothetical protein
MDEQSYKLDRLEDRNTRGAFTIFCDDFRTENNGKNLYLGVYGDTLLVPEFPALLPTFVIVTTAWTTPSNPFRKLIFRVLRNEEVIAVENVDIVDLDKQFEVLERTEEERRTLQSLPGPSVASSMRQRVFRVIRFVPFVIETESVIRVRVENEEGEFRTSGLIVRRSPGS